MLRSLRRLLKYLFLTVISLVVVLAITLGLLPSILKRAIPYWLQQSQLSAQIEEIQIQLLDGRLSVDNFIIQKDTKQTLKLESLVIQIDPRELFQRKIILQQLSVKGLNLELEQGPHGQLKLAGVLLPANQPTASPSGDNTKSRPWHVSINHIALNDLKGCYAMAGNPSVCATLQQFAWQGQLGFKLQPGHKEPINSIQGTLTLDLLNFHAKEGHGGQTLLGFSHLSLESIDINGLDQIDIERVNLIDPAALQRPSEATSSTTYTIRGKQLRAENVSYQARQPLSIATVTANGLQVILQREADGSLVLANMVRPYKQNRNASDSNTDTVQDDSHDFEYKIGRLNLQDQSSFKFTDNAVKPSAKVKLNEIELELRQVDSASADNRSPVHIKAIVGQHAQLQLQGNVALFAKRPTLKIKGDLKGLNVADFNSYAQQTIHHYVKSGHLDAVTSINIEQGQLDSETQLLLRQFYLEPTPDKESSTYKEQIGIPLGTALSLLRDRDNSIQLKLPITGDINKPDFSLDDVVRKVSAKAVRAAVINYYSPLGMLSLAGTLFDLATALRFDPVVFEPGKATLDSNDTLQLDKLVTVLTERPHIHLVVCGISTQADQLAWFGDNTDSASNSNATAASDLATPLSESQLARLNALARERSNIVKTYLLEHKQIHPQRLIVCTPKHQQADTQPPRTELQL